VYKTQDSLFLKGENIVLCQYRIIRTVATQAVADSYVKRSQWLWWG